MDTGMTINGQNCYDTWGVRLLKGCLGSVVCWPPLKDASVPVNNWQEEDGIEADLTAPKLDTRNVTINLSTDGDYGHYRGFIAELEASAYHNIWFGPLDKTLRLRLVRMGSYDYGKRLGFVTATFADDFPLDGYEYSFPAAVESDTLPYDLPFTLGGIAAPEGAYTLDGRLFENYGVHIILGTESSMWSHGAVKTALLTNNPSLQGAVYDGNAVVRTSAPQVKMVCLLRADNAAQMWERWNALLYDLTRPGWHSIGGGMMDEERAFYYKGCSVTEFAIDDINGAWIKFDIALQLLAPLPVDMAKTARNGFPYNLPFIIG